MRYDIDGTDFFESHVAFNKAVERARASRGPSIIVSDVVRLLPHSNADDHRKYRSEKEIEDDKKKDPLIVFSKKCIAKGIISKEEFEELDAKALEQVNKETEWADQQNNPSPNDVMKNMYIDNDPVNQYTSLKPKNVGDKVVLVDAINHALDEELVYNDKMMIYGEDVGGGKGGVFTATRGLTDKHGVDRVYNSPLAESSIVGTAIGLSTVGYKPVVEIQFADYIWTSMMQIRNELSTIRYRSNGDWSCPIVIRVPVGGYIHGGLCHSQSIEGYFAHLPGIKIAYPSNAEDAKGLLKTACRMSDPVIFMEHKGLYRQGFAARPEPDSDFLLEFGKASIVQEGDLSLIHI